MRRIVTTALALCVFNLVFAQTDTTNRISAPKIQVSTNDHFMIQLGHTSWQGKPDSINTSGFPRSFNLYFMLAFPFKTNPHWSVAIGPGIATDNIFFENTYVGIKDATSTLAFKNVKDTAHFKKYKLTTAFLEAPVELRYSTKPDDDKHSVKIAIGAKVATLLSAAVKGKTLLDKNGNTLNTYTSKEKSKRFFNTNRLSVTGRLGYGHLSLFTSYSITPVFKEGTAPDVRPLTIGLTLSGL